ncbi:MULTISPECIES: HAD family hydrolase [Psychrobacter]|jgi:HAD superfamily hydrolase (TIGR01490 family)|uniref:HAD-IB family hydrolase n=1 Tax=Psychrobacter communis TaxID=2762238 RepID=A0ABR8RHW8_9GAMM|nr:HAD-IB family hydrolase [Psychrobacter communis]MBD7947309.1 HAD-IB family hydrolase [Psychrobacter communis]
MNTPRLQKKDTVLVLFDLDHTLLDVDSDDLWGKYLVKHGYVNEENYGRTNQKFYQEYIAGTLDAIKYNEFVAQFLSTLPIKRLYEMRKDYVESEIIPHIRPKALRVLHEHLELGREVVITSATNDFLVSSIAQHFGLLEANIIATPLELKNQCYTGKLTDRPNFKEDKIYHIDKWLDKKKLANISFDKTYFYSDSKNDIPLLEWADVSICVTPDDYLRAYALTQQWLIEDW